MIISSCIVFSELPISDSCTSSLLSDSGNHSLIQSVHQNETYNSPMDPYSYQVNSVVPDFVRETCTLPCPVFTLDTYLKKVYRVS